MYVLFLYFAPQGELLNNWNLFIKWKLNLKRFIQSKLAKTQSIKMSGFSNPKYKLWRCFDCDQLCLIFLQSSTVLPPLPPTFTHSITLLPETLNLPRYFVSVSVSKTTQRFGSLRPPVVIKCLSPLVGPNTPYPSYQTLRVSQYVLSKQTNIFHHKSCNTAVEVNIPYHTNDQKTGPPHSAT